MAKPKLEITVYESGYVEVKMDGKIVRGYRSIKFDFDIREAPTHEIKFVSQSGGVGE